MPVSLLLVEGSLDVELLQPVLAGTPTVEIGGSKGSLAPRALDERKRTRANVCYVRDRDFDYDPPQDRSRPVADRHHEGAILGWRWCRHEIESYLIDPEIVTRATNWQKDAYSTELLGAARRIRHCQIARWVIGTVRRALPPHYELHTRPEECEKSDFRLPKDMTQAATFQWAKNHVSQFHARVTKAVGETALQHEFQNRSQTLTEAFLNSPENALVWCSGKDLITALEPWLTTQGIPNAQAFRARMRDWIRHNPEAALAVLLEWQEFVRRGVS